LNGLLASDFAVVIGAAIVSIGSNPSRRVMHHLR
jgi:hypothetical protein